MYSGTSSTLLRKIATTIAIFCVSLAAFSQTAKPQHAKLSLLAEHTALAPGGSEWIGLRFELEQGWHIYWTNPGDSGEPPKVTWHLPEGVHSNDLQFPTPQRIPDHGMTDYGYMGSVVLLSKLTVPASFASNKAEISADVRYLVCREVCVPAKEHLSMPLPLSTETRSSNEAQVIRKTEEQAPQPLPAGVYISATQNQNAFVMTFATRSPKFGLATDFIPVDEQVIENSTKPTIKPGKDGFQLTLKKSEQLNHPILQLRGVLITQDKAYNIAVPIAPAKAASAKAISQKTQTAKKSKE